MGMVCLLLFFSILAWNVSWLVGHLWSKRQYYVRGVGHVKGGICIISVCIK